MANPTTIVGCKSALMDTTGAVQTLAMRPDRNYAIKHVGLDSTNTSDDHTIQISVSHEDGTCSNPTAALTAGTDVIPLSAGDIYVTEQVQEIRYINFGGAPQLLVVEVNRNFFAV